jgi:hypothetical protein
MFWFEICLYLVICICSVLDLYLYFLLIDILDLLTLYQKVQNLFIYFFENIKTCTKPGPKPKLKNGFQTVGYNIITTNCLGRGGCG